MNIEETIDIDGRTHSFVCMACSQSDCGDCVQKIVDRYEAENKTVHQTTYHECDDVQDCGSQYVLEIVWT